MIPLKDNIRSNSFPIVNWMLIAANILVFLYEVSLRPAALDRFTTVFGAVPRNLHLLHPASLLANPLPLITLVTAMFLHGGWFHVLSNMWVLFIFGDNVEDRMGSGRYFVFYMISGIVANLIQSLAFPTSSIPAIGASGAIAGVLGAYFLFYPRARVFTLIPIFIIPWFVYVPAVLFLGFWFVSQLYSGIFSLGVNTGGVAWWAHVGGFAFGLVFARLFARQVLSYSNRFPPDSPTYYG
ncbi:MAG: rhomboid family intramembrane serine protease [Omnitrophica WOR_2 bacterium]